MYLLLGITHSPSRVFESPRTSDWGLLKMQGALMRVTVGQRLLFGVGAIWRHSYLESVQAPAEPLRAAPSILVLHWLLDSHTIGLSVHVRASTGNIKGTTRGISAHLCPRNQEREGEKGKSSTTIGSAPFRRPCCVFSPLNTLRNVTFSSLSSWVVAGWLRIDSTYWVLVVESGRSH